MPDSPPDKNQNSSLDTVLKLRMASTYEEYLLDHPEVAVTMHGRSREVRIDADDQRYFSTFKRPIHLVTVANSESPSTPIVVPILERIGRNLLRSSFWIVDPEVGDELIQTMEDVPDSLHNIGADDLPVLLVLDSDLRFLTVWGPHPQGFASRWSAWVAEQLDAETGGPEALSIAADTQYAIRLWYNSGLTSDCIAEIRQRLETLHADTSDLVGASDSGASKTDRQD